jgi:hypothetical protein
VEFAFQIEVEMIDKKTIGEDKVVVSADGI